MCCIVRWCSFIVSYLLIISVQCDVHCPCCFLAVDWLWNNKWELRILLSLNNSLWHLVFWWHCAVLLAPFLILFASASTGMLHNNVTFYLLMMATWYGLRIFLVNLLENILIHTLSYHAVTRYVFLYTVSQKNHPHRFFVHIFAKYWPILKSSSPYIHIHLKFGCIPPASCQFFFMELKYRPWMPWNGQIHRNFICIINTESQQMKWSDLHQRGGNKNRWIVRRQNNSTSMLDSSVWTCRYTRLPSSLPASSILCTSCAAREDTLPGPDWQRSRGRPRTTWVHHICSDINTSALDALRQARDTST